MIASTLAALVAVAWSIGAGADVDPGDDDDVNGSITISASVSVFIASGGGEEEEDGSGAEDVVAVVYGWYLCLPDAALMAWTAFFLLSEIDFERGVPRDLS